MYTWSGRRLSSEAVAKGESVVVGVTEAFKASSETVAKGTKLNA